MKKLLVLLVAISIHLCCFSAAFSASFEETKRAAEQGDANAQTVIGSMYDLGLGLPQDYQQAKQWYEKAAAQENSNAQLNLGVMYANGHGVRQDYHQGKQWFEKAAAQNNVNAQYNLGIMYENGQGVRQNIATAKEWYGRACDNGEQRGCDAYARLNR